jgi:hypothetical protein
VQPCTRERVHHGAGEGRARVGGGEVLVRVGDEEHDDDRVVVIAGANGECWFAAEDRLAGYCGHVLIEGARLRRVSD